jgi:16S rRNA G966 N2-methylase RsmD
MAAELAGGADSPLPAEDDGDKDGGRHREVGELTMPRDESVLTPAAQTSEPLFHPLASLFPLLEGVTFDALRDDIAAHGLREPITLYHGAILDGRNRERGCRALGIKPRYRDYTGDDPLGFVVSANLHRRHLNESQRAMVAAKIATMRQGERTDLAQICARSQVDAATALNVSRRSTQHAKQVQTRGAPELVAAVERGQLAVSAAAEIASLTAAEQRRILASLSPREIGKAWRAIKRQRKEAWRAERQAAYAATAATVPDASARYTLHHAPCISALDILTPASVDLIVTDPPYTKESMPVYTDLAKVAAHVLKPGGLCLIMSGQAHLPEVIERLGAHLVYRWTIAYLTPVSTAQCSSQGIGIAWKPVLVYGKAAGRGNDRFFVDVVRSDAPDKRYHPWGQSESGFTNLMRPLIRPGDVVLEPFLGGGTTLIAALTLGASAIAFDTDEKAIEATKARIAAMGTEGER